MIGSPVEEIERHPEPAVAPGDGFENFDTCRDDFLADTVARYSGDTKSPHFQPVSVFVHADRATEPDTRAQSQPQ